MISLQAGGNDKAWYEQPGRLKNGRCRAVLSRRGCLKVCEDPGAKAYPA